VVSAHVLAELPIADIDQFMAVFRTDGLTKRQEHGCIRTHVFQPVDDAHRVVVMLEWPSVEAFERFRDDETAPPIMRRGGAQGPPTFRVLSSVTELDG
jgi:quinol monooxygenase YgiN